MHARVIETVVPLLSEGLAESIEVFGLGRIVVSCSPGTVCISVVRNRENIPVPDRIRRLSTNALISPVWMMRAGCSAIPFTRSMVWVRVPLTSGFASLLKPMCRVADWTNNGFPNRPAGLFVGGGHCQVYRREDAARHAKSVPAPPYARHFRALRRDCSNL